MNYRIASLLLATSMATAAATATATSSKAYRIFSDPPRPKTAKAFPSSSSVSEESFIPAKSSKLLSLSSALPIPSAKTVKSKVGKMMSKAVKCTKALDDDQSVSLSMPTLAKSGKTAKMAKCLPMSVSMSIDIVTAMPTYYPTYVPTAQPTTRRPTQRMVCQSGDFVDALGRDCFWYEHPNVELGCETLRDESTDVDLTNGDGKTPWDECCFCGGGTMGPEDTTPSRNLKLLAEPKDLGAEQKMEVFSVSADLAGAADDTNNIVCISGRDFVDPLGRDCFFYVAENIERGCESLHGRGDLANVFSWTNNEGETPWDECCWCGGGTLVYEPALIVKESSTPLP